MTLPAQYEGVMPLAMVQQPPYMCQVEDAPSVSGETKPYRHIKAKDGLIERPDPEVATVYDIFRRSAKLYANKEAIGSRKLIRTHVEKKKVPKIVDGVKKEVEKEWTYYELSPYTFLTYKDYEARALAVGAGLRKLGLQAGDILHLFASTRSVKSLLSNTWRGRRADNLCYVFTSAPTGNAQPTARRLSPSLSRRPMTLSAPMRSNTR